jgi:glycosyltransferase involved in cell wall biosynthesis
VTTADPKTPREDVMGFDAGLLGDVTRRTAARLSGRLRGSTAVSEIAGQLALGHAALQIGSDAGRLDSLLKACRWTQSGTSHRLMRRLLEPYLTGRAREVARRDRVGWERYFGAFSNIDKERALTTSLVLKAPRPGGEKGVLYCSFEYNWMRLVANHDARAILDEYYVVGQSSWSPIDYASLAAFAGLSSDPLFVGISHLSDVEIVSLFRPVAEPLPILASDWIDPATFSPKPHAERTIDILMVANWSRVKRHWLLFEALKDMPRNLRVVLVGRNAPGRTETEILDEAHAFGVKQQLELRTNLEIDEVAALQCDARISTIFSQREGSCVSVAESLFAGSPVAMMDEAHVGSRSYINYWTGELVRRQGLAATLERFHAESERYAPREWALANISCATSSQRLNKLLRNWARATRRPWTEDAAPLRWRYVPVYLNAADEARLQPAVEELQRRHGVVLQAFPGERAAKRRQEGAPPEPPPKVTPIRVLDSVG